MTAALKSLADWVVETALRSEWAQANRELAMRVAQDYADLYVRLLQGQDVRADLAVARASLKSLGSAAASTAASAIETAIWRAVGKAVVTLMR